MTTQSHKADIFQPPRFGPGYMKPMRAFFLRMNDDEDARREFLKDADTAIVTYGIIDKLPGIKAIGHADTQHKRTLVLPPAPPQAPAGLETAGYALRAAEGARASTNVAFFVRPNLVYWFALAEMYWGLYDVNYLSPADQIILKTFDDPEFKTQLLENPQPIFEDFGLHVPTGIQITMVEQTENIVHVILPPIGDLNALSYEALEEIVSGWHWHRALGEPGLGDVTLSDKKN